MTRVAGVDISSTAANVVVLDAALDVIDARLWSAADPGGLADHLTGCDVVAIDAPDRWSRGPIPEHAGLSPKFDAARCAEFELARKFRYWVPWVTPQQPAPGTEGRHAWIQRGIELFEHLPYGTTAIEVYPHSIFRRLAGEQGLPPKSRLAGLLMRAQLLVAAGMSVDFLEMWSHDSLDAAAAAVVALHAVLGKAERVSCDHDGSAMWLPARLEGASG